MRFTHSECMGEHFDIKSVMNYHKDVDLNYAIIMRNGLELNAIKQDNSVSFVFIKLPVSLCAHLCQYANGLKITRA